MLETVWFSLAYIWGLCSDETLLGRVSQALRNILNTELPFTVLFQGNVDLLTRCADKYMYGILISACKKAITRCW